MDIGTARLIMQLQLRSTHRALAEMYYVIEHNDHGDQMAGCDLIVEAKRALYLHPDFDESTWDRNTRSNWIMEDDSDQHEPNKVTRQEDTDI